MQQSLELTRQQNRKVSIGRNKNETIPHKSKSMKKFTYAEEFFFELVQINKHHKAAERVDYPFLGYEF